MNSTKTGRTDKHIQELHLLKSHGEHNSILKLLPTPLQIHHLNLTRKMQGYTKCMLHLFTEHVWSML